MNSDVLSSSPIIQRGPNGYADATSYGQAEGYAFCATERYAQGQSDSRADCNPEHRVRHLGTPRLDRLGSDFSIMSPRPHLGLLTCSVYEAS